MLSRLTSRVFVNDGRRFFCRATERLNWDVISAVCLERRPVITKELTELEKQVLSYWERVEVEQSLKSDFEVKHDAETTAASGSKKKSESGSTKKTAGASITVMSHQDILDQWKKELHEVNLAPRLTEADKKEDVKSVERKLDCRLFLLVKQSGTGDRWTFPQGICTEGETLRESAERVLRHQCGPDVNARFISNAPCGFFQYGYPRSHWEKTGNSIGAKVFFYKAELLGGLVESSAFQWLTKGELLGIVDKKYAKSLDNFLFDDS